MIAYKFLAGERVARFSGLAWPATEWVEAEGPLDECRNGIHACRIEDLPYWLDSELWEVELQGRIIAGELKLVAERGRLVRLIEEWNEALRREFAAECVRRVAMHAADELRDAGLDDEADALARARDRDSIARAATSAVTAAYRVDARVAERLAGYAADAVEWSTEYSPSSVAYVAAHTAAARSNGGGGDPFEEERREQARWLAERLGLSRAGA